MSLLVRVRVNSGPDLAAVEIRRVAPDDTRTDADAWIAYHWEIWMVGPADEHYPEGRPQVTQRGTVTHRYGDGVLALLHRVLGQG